MINDILSWFADPANWSGESGVPHRLLQHLGYTAVSLLVAALIAIPVGLAIGHTGRGRFLAINIAGAARAIPSLGLLYLMVLWLFPKLAGDSALVVPSIIVLIVLAIPPIMAGAYAGVEGVEPAARDAAKGMGMTGMQVLRQVEVPCAAPLIFSGLRSATLQVVSTATIAAVAGTGGLGRYLIDGQKLSDYEQMAAGALLVGGLALLLDLILSIVQRTVVSPGLGGGRGSGRRGSSRGRAGAGAAARTGTSGNTPVDVEIDSSGRTVDAPAR
ncbi:ABC transporter permease subunit [Pedococcus aerophilus]|uniref:ABC transporter permease subunit n=1 Tax=Pedococcus aerophilus TaxID=436356 RepID=A0ABN3UPG3_9MICO